MKRSFQGLLLLGLGALLVGGIFVLLRWRLDKGDGYPSYSTLRSDPKGARAFYETLQRLHPGNVRQNFIPLGREDPRAATTWWFLGVNDSSTELMTAAGDAHLSRVLAKGGDVIITLGSRGSLELLVSDKGEEEEEAKNEEHENDEIVMIREEAERKRTGWLLHGLETEWLTRDGDLTVDGELVVDAPEAWPDVYESRSPKAFDPLPDRWQPVYEKDGMALVIQRRIGRGRLILINDSFAFSNEAMFNQRQSAFLQAVIGSNSRFVFNETHLGTAQQRGVMNLIRDYGLQGVLVSFLLLALLYIWRAGSSLLPTHTHLLAEDDHVLGESSNEGFRHFLAHHVSSDDVVQQCLTEWQRSWGAAAERDPGVAEQLQRARTEFEQARGNKASPMAQYNQLTKILTRKHFSQTGS